MQGASKCTIDVVNLQGNTTNLSLIILYMIKSGVPGLDEVLMGGFVEHSAILLRGGAGAGKTIFGLQFLSNGADHGYSALCITLGESVDSLKRNASALGIKTDQIVFLDLSPDPNFFSQSESYDIFNPSDVEREPTTSKIVEVMERVNPSLVFIDAMTQLRYLSNNDYQFRRQVLSFLHFLKENGATILFTSEYSDKEPDDDLRFMADAVISLEHTTYQRYLRIDKMRGSGFLNGDHTFKITSSGIVVFPNLFPKETSSTFGDKVFTFGNESLDKLTGGGIEEATVSMITGPSGIGKSTLAFQLAVNSIRTGTCVDFYSFEEEVNMLITRARAIGLVNDSDNLGNHLMLKKVEPLTYGVDEFSHLVISNVRTRNTGLVIIDSIAGFKLSLNGKDVVSKMHALCKTLQNLGVAVILIHETESLVGWLKLSDDRLSYLADNIIFLQYFELQSSLNKCIGVLKKRLGKFEKKLRMFDITSHGIVVSDPLLNISGMLSGIPQFIKNDSE